MSYQFPVDTCVVACSGPSLNKVDVFSLGVPVCAISTTIRSIPNPNYWFIADTLNDMHGEEGAAAWEKENVIKVVPTRSNRSGGKNIVTHEYHEAREPNRQYETLLFQANTPLLRGPHKTLTFAIQWLHVCGVKNIIFAGNDLQAESFDKKYSYQLKDYDKRKEHNFKKTLDQIKDALFSWYPVAKAKGYEWYSYECGDIFETIVPKFNSDVLKNVKANPYYVEPRVNESAQVQQMIQTEVIKEYVEKEKLSELDRNRREYNRLMREREDKEKAKRKVNMGVYFDLIHKRKK